jgi:hypothetical protein
MPLIKCPECGRDVAADAAGCPSCGTPIAARRAAAQEKQSRGRAFMFVLGLVFFIVIGNAVMGKPKSPAPAAETSAAAGGNDSTVASGTPAAMITVKEMPGCVTETAYRRLKRDLVRAAMRQESNPLSLVERTPGCKRLPHRGAVADMQNVDGQLIRLQLVGEKEWLYTDAVAVNPAAGARPSP